MNYKLTIEYDGTRYEGWQRQKSTDQTIQGKLESVLSRMYEREITIDGAGRTDAGVHAKAQVASVTLPGNQSPQDICNYLNQYLPEDICVTEVQWTAPRFHARLWACGKCYSYRIGIDDYKNVFERKYIYPLGQKLDTQAMKQAAGFLIGEHDFKSFCGNAKMKKSTVRTITSIEIKELEHEVCITYQGTGFLQYMVRILTGTLIEVGLGRRSAESIPALIEAKDRRQAGETAPAKGLCLEWVEYSEK